jgi:glycosyltransferase involved in cell wall biosynthesis
MESGPTPRAATAQASQRAKICLISNYVPDGQPSMLRYGEMLERMLRERGYQPMVVHPPAVLGGLTFLRGGARKWAGNLDKYLIAPWYLRWKCRGADLVHICDHSNAVYLSCAGRKPHVVTCHDLIGIRSGRGEFRDVKVGRTGRMLQAWIASSLVRAKNVICVSQKTAADLRAMAGDTGATITVIYSALNREFGPVARGQVEQALTKLGLQADAEYLLHVGANVWYKNRPGVMRIFGELRKWPEFGGLRLIVAGKAWDGELRDLRRTLGLEEWAIEARDVSDDDLRALYTGAKALLFPSLEEGFGWPVLEAQACGCPVVTSNRAPMTEIAGEAAVFVDPADPGAAARTIREQWLRRDALREAGFHNLDRFNEDKMMDALCEVYDRALAAGSG